jgi:Sec-independent protein translocase protein TatA
MARTFGRAMRQIRDASQQIQDDIRNAAEDQPTNQQVVEKEDSKNND